MRIIGGSESLFIRNERTRRDKGEMGEILIEILGESHTFLVESTHAYPIALFVLRWF